MSLKWVIDSRAEQLEAHRRDFKIAWEIHILPQLELEFGKLGTLNKVLAHRGAWNRWLADADRKARKG